ncbi:uncharacterized protein LOC132181964 [Corylus avellana]|uniref:uncharacterized protein LOC132181964 n=1 Tax=Corylus avellana TaxID=13451 RepID=UPI00286BFE53|nr:uncharacterized protein LOC132181964 [Corylus avellana]
MERIYLPSFWVQQLFTIDNGLLIFLFCIFFLNPPSNYQPFSRLLSTCSCPTPTTTPNSPTNISHIVFGIVGALNTWNSRKPYVESWWRPNITRGYLFLDKPPGPEFQPWPSNLPPLRVSEDVRKIPTLPKTVKPIPARIVRAIIEAFREGDKNVRWYVMGDDDTIFFLDNLIGVLAKYNHSKYYYIGSNSESVISNIVFSFDMAFGGAGYALSYPAVEALAAKLDSCIERDPQKHFSDYILHSCLADLGISLTLEKGFHQIDMRNDTTGFLSAQPHTPFLSFHHIDAIDPIFPSMNRSEAINHLMKAAKADQSRLLQQTICYHRPTNWSFSVSWGYSAYIYENIIPRSILCRPLQTFTKWRREVKLHFYMFYTRPLSSDPCQAPHVFFFDSIELTQGDEQVITTYIRKSPRGLPNCSSTGNHSADAITKIQVLSPATTRLEAGGRDCCDIEYADRTSVTQVKYRPCLKNEVIA